MYRQSSIDESFAVLSGIDAETYWVEAAGDCDIVDEISKPGRFEACIVAVVGLAEVDIRTVADMLAHVFDKDFDLHIPGLERHQHSPPHSKKDLFGYIPKILYSGSLAFIILSVLASALFQS